MGMLKTVLSLSRFDNEHRLIERRAQVMKSWTKHFFDLLYEPLGYTVNTLTLINDITATARTLAPAAGAGTPLPNLIVASPGGGCGAWSGKDTNLYNQPPGDVIGIIIGTDNTIVSPTQDALFVKVPHGIAAGSVLYGGTEILPPVFAGANGTMVIRRYFTNLSGGNISIQEVGLYSPGYTTGLNSAVCFCIARDVVAPSVDIVNTDILEVTYTVQITV